MNEFTLLDFPVEKVKFQTLMRNEEHFAEVRKISPDPATPAKILEGYGEVQFPPAPEDRPYTFASIVVSVDGKISFVYLTYIFTEASYRICQYPFNADIVSLSKFRKFRFSS